MAFSIGTLRHEKLRDVHTPHLLGELESEVCAEDEADSKITAHQGNASAHHAKTNTFSELNGQWGLSQAYRGADGKVMVFKGPDADPVEEDKPGAFDRFRDYISWSSLDGYVTGGDSGYSVAPYGSSVYLLTPYGSNVDAWFRSGIYWYRLFYLGTTLSIEFVIAYVTLTSNLNAWLRFAGACADPPSETISHLGFKLINGSIHASNANGSAQSITDTMEDLPFGDQLTRLKVVYDGSSCRFYVNEVLKVTHSSHLPNMFSNFLHAHLRCTANGSREMLINRVLIERTY